MLTFSLLSWIFLNFLNISWGLSPKLSQKLIFPHLLHHKNCTSFLIHLLHQEIYPNFYFLENFLDQKFISNPVFSSDVWWKQWKSNCMVSTNFLAQKTIGMNKKFLKFFVSRNVFEKGDFCQFLASKFHNKIQSWTTPWYTTRSRQCLQNKSEPGLRQL